MIPYLVINSATLHLVGVHETFFFLIDADVSLAYYHLQLRILTSLINAVHFSGVFSGGLHHNREKNNFRAILNKC